MARYESRLLAFCRHLLGSREDAEDVLQEVMTAAFNAILADDRPINVRPWLYRIARNRSLNHLRRAQADRRGLDGPPLLRARRHHRRQGPRARGVPPPGGRHPRAARDPEDRAGPARDGRAVLRADRRGDGDDRPQRQVAARACARIARRGRRGPPAVLRPGPDRARRGRRGAPAPAQPARPPPPAQLQALQHLPRPSSRRPTARSPRCCRSGRWRCSTSCCSCIWATRPRRGRPRRRRRPPRAPRARALPARVPARAGAAGAGAAGAGAALAGGAAAGSSGLISAGIGAIAGKAAAGLAAAALVTAGAVEAGHSTPPPSPPGHRGADPRGDSDSGGGDDPVGPVALWAVLRRASLDVGG